MAKQTLNLGTAPAGADGDTVRAAFVKTEANMAELYAWLGASGSPVALPANFPATRAFSRATILGTVSQASGVPTGAVIERGSNANGEYVRYADGTQICWKTVSTDASSSAIGAIYGSNAYGAGAYPAAFISLPNVSYCGYIASGTVNAMWAGCYTPPTQANWGNYRLLSAGSYGAGVIHLIAVGRWF